MSDRRCSIASPYRETKEPEDLVIDRIRQDIQQRLDQLLAEADKLRRALVALDPRERKPVSRAQRSSPAPAPTKAAPKPSAVKPRATQPAPVSGSAGPPKPASPAARTAPGATKAKVLGALSKDVALTAGDVAKATGLARPTVSTTLSKLAKTGEAVKAERGYRLAAQPAAAPAAAAPVPTEDTNS
jgi:DNA-binding transcriptional ArsR family regulator